MLNKIMKKANKISILFTLALAIFGLSLPVANASLLITTNNASNITYSGAVLNGMIQDTTLSVNAWFELGTNANLLNMSTSPRFYNSLSNSFNAPVGGLYPSTTYYYRAVAENSEGRTYGNILSFRTSYYDTYTNNTNNQNLYGTQPAITTNPATAVSGNSAVLNGFVNGNNLSTTAWFEWGTSTNFGNSTTQNPYGSGVRGYDITLTGLMPNTVYFYRAVAQNVQGRVFGSTVSFTTGNMVYTPSYPTYPNYYPTYPIGITLDANTEPATNIRSTSAELNALIINSNGISSNTYFEWGTNSNLGRKTEVIATGNFPAVRHVATITGLSAGTTYYFRPVVENGSTRNVGNTSYFTTTGSSASTTTNTNTTVEDTYTPAPTKNTSTITPVNLGANALGTSFLPKNIYGWLLLIILVLALVILSKRIFTPNYIVQERLMEIPRPPH